MCGIIGYVGSRDAVPIILDGLRRLEYRGYDSAGIAVGASARSSLELRRAAGKLSNLEDAIRSHPVRGSYGVGHTRWATHGRPTEENAHPHSDCSGRIVVVHNGIIENYLALKQELAAQGHRFQTETDTEVIAHLIEREFGGDRRAVTLEESVRRAVRRLDGSFALGVISADEPEKIVAARSGPPAIVGLGAGSGDGESSDGKIECFLASDVPGILHRTRHLYFLADGDMAILSRAGVEFTDFSGNAVVRELETVHWDPIQAEKGGYKHFMLKEIFEQPRAIRDTVAGRVSLDSGKVFLNEIGVDDSVLRSIDRVHVAACGTSWHAAVAGKYMIEALARVPVEIDYASEYRYREPPASANTLGMLITQSGETADTLAAEREMIQRGAKTIAITNVVGSMAAREAHGTIYTHAGPEIGVASTKAFSAQLAALFLFALHLANLREAITPARSRELIESLGRVPASIEKVLGSLGSDCERLAARYHAARDFLYLGRGIHFPIALEGALKLKEVSYIHAEGYPAGEMKHGPNALIDESLPVLVIATRDESVPGSMLRYEKTLSNIQEVTARSGQVIAVAVEGDSRIERLASHVLYLPRAPEMLLPLVEVVPLQLLAYYIAVRRGCDVDQPRNLAKSVTVE